MNSKQPELKDFEVLSIDSIVKRYQEGIGKINQKVFNLSTEEVRVQFKDNSNLGLWSCKEVLGHIVDAEIAVTHRMRRIVAEDKPLLAIWDENQFIKNDLYSGNSIIEFVDLIKSIRTFTGIWLSSLSENQFARIAIHPERGEQSLKTILTYITWHLENHCWYLDRKIESLSK